MAISRTTRPRMIVFGVVDSVRELRKKPENGGEVYGHEVVVRQPDGGTPAFTAYVSSGVQFSVGEFVAVECSLEESRNYGASLNYESSGENVLDLIASSMLAAA